MLYDDIDKPLVEKYNWIAGKYVYAWFNGKTRYLHREIMQPGDGLEVDHINGNRLDNRRCNLRICTRSQNNANWHGKHRSGSSKFRGVCFRKDTSKWQSEIQVDKKRVTLGCFDDESEAAHVYDTAARQLFGEFAYQNFGAN